MSVKKSLAWMGTAQAASFLVQFAASLILARYLSPHEMGVFAVGLATMGMLALVQNFSLQSLIVREPVLTPSVETTAFTVNAALSAVLSLATIACAYLGSSFLGDDGVRRVLLVLSTGPLIGILSFLPGAQLERNARFKEIALISAASSVAGALATVMLAVLGFGYMSLAYASVVSNVVLASTFIVVGRHHFSCRLGITEWRRVSEFGAQMFAYAGIGAFSQRICDILMGRILGLAGLGLYNRAGGLNGMIWGNIHSLLSRVALVDFSQTQRDGRSIRDRYLQAVGIVTAVLWPAFAGLALLARPIILVLYGERWEAAAMPLTYLALSSMILVALTMTAEMFAVTGTLRTQTRIEAIRAPFSIALFVGGCLVSLNAVAFSRVLEAILAVVLYRSQLDRITCTNLRDFKGIYGKCALLTLAAITPALLVMALVPDELTKLLSLAAIIILGVVCWFSMLFTLHHPLATEISATVRNRKIKFA